MNLFARAQLPFNRLNLFFGLTTPRIRKLKVDISVNKVVRSVVSILMKLVNLTDFAVAVRSTLDKSTKS